MKIYLISISVLLLTVSCGKTKKPSDINSKEALEITDWARPGAQGQMSGAYFVYKNSLDIADTLVSAQSPQTGITQIHESYTTEEGLSGMRQKNNIVIPSGEELTLQPGGLHVMLMNLKQDLTTSDSVVISLTFARAGEKELKIPVLANN